MHPEFCPRSALSLSLSFFFSLEVSLSIRSLRVPDEPRLATFFFARLLRTFPKRFRNGFRFHFWDMVPKWRENGAKTVRKRFWRRFGTVLTPFCHRFGAVLAPFWHRFRTTCIGLAPFWHRFGTVFRLRVPSPHRSNTGYSPMSGPHHVYVVFENFTPTPNPPPPPPPTFSSNVIS